MKKKIALLIAVLLCGWIALPYLIVQLLGWRTVRRGPLAGGQVALTFDDGPHPIHTPAILELLAKHKMQATFFVLEGPARKHPELLRQMQREDHEIGVHGRRHVHGFVLPPHLALQNFTHTTDLIEKIVGQRPRWGRPPHGAYSLATLPAVRRADLQAAHWSLESGDWKAKATPEQLRRTVLNKAQSGAVIVMHDDRHVTAAALDEILRGLGQKGLRGVTLGALGAVPLTARDLPARVMGKFDDALDQHFRFKKLQSGGLLRFGAVRFALADRPSPFGGLKKGAKMIEFHVNNALFVEIGTLKFHSVAARELHLLAVEWAQNPEWHGAELLFCISIHWRMLERLGFETVELSPADEARLLAWSAVLHRVHGNKLREGARVRLSVMSRARLQELLCTRLSKFGD